jgi:hypothetical protein
MRDLSLPAIHKHIKVLESAGMVSGKGAVMKKFVFIYHGSAQPDQGNMDAWMAWFATIGEKMVDPGNPFGAGKEITPSGAMDLAQDKSAATGYSIVNAASMEDAVKLLKRCPIVTSVRVYQALSM